MANGQDRDSVDKLTYRELAHIYYSFKLGLAGPFKDYLIAYNLNPPRNKEGKIIPFMEMFKQVNDCIELKLDSRIQTPEEQAKAAMEQLGFFNR